MARVRKADLEVVIRFGQLAEINEADIKDRIRFRTYDRLFRRDCNYRMMVVMNFVRVVNPDEYGFGDLTEVRVRGYAPENMEEYSQLRRWYEQNLQAKESGDYHWDSDADPIFLIYLVDGFSNLTGSIVRYGMDQAEFDSRVKSKTPRKF